MPAAPLPVILLAASGSRFLIPLKSGSGLSLPCVDTMTVDINIADARQIGFMKQSGE